MKVLLGYPHQIDNICHSTVETTVKVLEGKKRGLVMLHSESFFYFNDLKIWCCLFICNSFTQILQDQFLHKAGFYTGCPKLREMFVWVNIERKLRIKLFPKALYLPENSHFVILQNNVYLFTSFTTSFYKTWCTF